MRIKSPTGPEYTTNGGSVFLSGDAFYTAYGYPRVNVVVQWANLTTGTSGAATSHVDWGSFFGNYYPIEHNWSGKVPLGPGRNVIVVSGSDGGSNSGSDTIGVIRTPDVTPPAISIIKPTSGATTTLITPPLQLAGTASDNIAVRQVRWANAATGGQGLAKGTELWSALVPLVAGLNEIVVHADDEEGNSASDSLMVTFNPDNQDPTVTITSLSTNALSSTNAYRTTSNAVHVSGISSDNGGVVLVNWVNALTGGSGAATGLSSWGAFIPLDDGDNPITFSAVDALGNVGTYSIVMTKDTQGPVIVVTSPPTDPYAAGGPSLIISGTASDLAGLIQVQVWNTTTGSHTLAAGTSTWSATMVLAAGMNTIRIDTSDLLGNWTRVDRTVTASGPVHAWGNNLSGALGNGTAVSCSLPALVDLPAVVGLSSLNASTFAVLADATVREWGMGVALTPSPVVGLSGVTQAARGGRHGLALLADGTVRAWGNNMFGQLGDGTTLSSDMALPVPGLADVRAVAAAGLRSAALLRDGTVKVWGDEVLVPTTVPGLDGIVELVLSSDHALALRSDGTIRSWGKNSYGQLGDGTFTDAPIPVMVTGLCGAVSVAVGAYHSLALLSDGTVRAWGDNVAGSLGDGTLINRNTPVPTIALAGVTRIAGGFRISAAILSDGTVMTWGNASGGALGRIVASGTNSNPTPGLVLNLSAVKVISAGSGFMVASQ